MRRKQGGKGDDDRSIFTCPVCSQDVDGGVPALARHLKEEHLGDGGGGGGGGGGSGGSGDEAGHSEDEDDEDEDEDKDEDGGDFASVVL